MMSRFWQDDVEDFHVKFGLLVRETPRLPDEKTLELRVHLIKEEMTEVMEALENHDMVGIADGIADAIVVLLGTAVSCGIDMADIWEEVHATNMNKVGGGVREDGKILKPLGWRPPAVASLLRAQGWKDGSRHS